MHYFQRLSLSLLLCFTLVQCSNNSRSGNTAFESTGNNYIQVLDEMPQHVQELENLTVFPGDAEPIYSIKLIPEQTYGKSGDYLTQVQDCVVDDNGSVIIVDRNNSRPFPFANILYVYNADGTYHAQIGGPGRGPGEYGMVMFPQAKAGKLFLYDFTSQRLNVYNTDDYAFERTTLVERWAIRDHETAQGLNFGGYKARNDGNYLAVFYKPNAEVSTYLLMDTEGNALDFEPLLLPSSLSIKVPDEPMRPPLSLPFLGTTRTVLSSEDVLYSIWTQDFLIKKYDPRGAYQSAIYYPVKGPPFDLNEYAKKVPFSLNVNEIEKAFESTDEELPQTFPVIDELMVDDENRIWVAVPTAVQGETYEWWILKETGELLAKLLLPVEQQIYAIKNGYLYTKKTNEETGTEFVVKYRIELTEK